MRWHSIALAGFLAGAQLDAGSIIRLKARAIDTSTVYAAVPANNTQAAGPLHKIVQFETAPSATQIAALEAAGAKVLAFVPEDAVLVSVDASGALPVEGVRWAAAIDAGDKISPDLALAGAATVLVELYPDVDLFRGRAVVVQAGLELVENPDLRGGHILARGTAEQIGVLAAADEVAYVFPAMAEVAQGAPVLACAGPSTNLGLVGQYVATAGYGWEGPGRASAALRYFISNTPSGYPAGAARATLARALTTWSKYVRVDFIAGGSANAAGSVNLSFASRDHGDGFPFDGPGHTLAHSFYPAPLIPEPLAGDMHFDADEAWGALAGTDLFSVALHEAGHTLGLGHSDNPGDVMYPYYRIASDLAPGDVAAIRTLYASRVASDPGPLPIPQPGAALSIEVSSPPSSVQASAWTFSGRASGGSGPVAVRWSNGAASGAASGSTSWRTSVPLAVGANVLVFTAIDSAGAQATATTVVVRTTAATSTTPPAPANPGRDAAAPVLSIKSPGSSYVLTSAATVTLSGTASDNVGIDRVAWAAAGGTSGVAGGTTRWVTEPIPLNVGTNSIVVRAFDAAGNSSWRSVTVVRR